MLTHIHTDTQKDGSDSMTSTADAGGNETSLMALVVGKSKGAFSQCIIVVGVSFLDLFTCVSGYPFSSNCAN